MTDKPEKEKPIINPFYDIPMAAQHLSQGSKLRNFLDKLIKYKDQAGFLHEAYFQGGFQAFEANKDGSFSPSGLVQRELQVAEFYLEKENKIYACRTFSINYIDDTSNQIIPVDAIEEKNEKDPYRVRSVDMLFIGPQDITACNNYYESLVASITDFGYTVTLQDLYEDNNSVFCRPIKTRDNSNQEDASPFIKSLGLTCKEIETVPSGLVEKDLSRVPSGFFLKDRETFIFKILSTTHNQIFHIRFSYIPYKDLGLNTK